MNERQRQQEAFAASQANLTVGQADACPIAVETLLNKEALAPYIVEAFTSGLTAEVFHLQIAEQHYTLKLKRPKPLVLNLDGKHSFLNEVQRRADFRALKDNPDTATEYENIVPTIYANYQQGIMLSPWIHGELINEVTEKIVAELFSTLVACEQVGLFEWDLCNGNIVIDNQGSPQLFDFGYMYRFDPLMEFNSDGPEAGIFNFIERFETRFLSGWFLTNTLSESENLQRFELVKRQGAIALESKLAWLTEAGASDHVLQNVRDLLTTHSRAIANETELSKKYLLDMFRSHVLDIEDDLGGKSCTPVTLKRVATVQDGIRNHYSLLRDNGVLFHFNKGKSAADLLATYEKKLIEAQQYQISRHKA